MTAATSTTATRTRRFLLVVVVLISFAFGAALLLGLTTIQADGTVFDPGPIVTFGLPVAKAAVDVSATLTIGILLVAGFCVPVGSKPWNRLLDAAPWCSAMWMASNCVTAVMTSLSLTGPVQADALGASLAQFFEQIAVGQAWIATILMTAALTVLTFAARHPAGIAASVCLGLSALVPLALQGHAAGAGNHVTATVALWLHIVGAAMWVGGLVAAVYAAALDESGVVPLLRRYSGLALVGLVTVTVSGSAGALVRLNDPTQLVTTVYGRVLGLKIILLLLLAALGWAQRKWVIRRFGDPEATNIRRRIAFVWLAVWELVIMGVAMGAGASLSRTETPGGQILLATKAEQLTGDLLPPAPAVGRIVDTWVFDSAAVLTVGLVLGAYLTGVATLRRQSRWPHGRTVAAIMAAIVMLFAACSLPGAYATFSFTAYTANLLLGGMLGAALAVTARPITLLNRVIPAREDGSLGPREWMRWAIDNRGMRYVLGTPWLAGSIQIILLGLVFLTPWLGWAVQDPVGRTVTTVFVFGATAIFAVSIGRTARSGTQSIAQAVGIALGVVLLAGMVAVFVAFAPGGVLPNWYGITLPALGVDPAVDQLVGALLVWGVMACSVLAMLVSLGRRVTEQKTGTMEQGD
ncbi:bifunctional copper resistance protein CopD/cytochrome c oxidase assembly protein [Leifsonia sp. NCR5]|uniref:bifunctional copper resistance protein CopD/cytochrome c oxidase assembly protein n=1 Tax=Leifsonia sp. NCR5 TaxID=1978342 RepID=UPI000A18A817|nr:cytochrome c oxidase assembly protein [Leifsonia sp. NCR5]